MLLASSAHIHFFSLAGEDCNLFCFSEKNKILMTTLSGSTSVFLFFVVHVLFWLAEFKTSQQIGVTEKN